MSIKLSTIRKKLSKDVVRAAEQKTKKMLQSMKLAEVRELHGLTQEKLAEKLKIRQSSLSKFEGRGNVRIETLKEHIEALGGKLQVQAVFRDFIIPLNINVRQKNM